MDRKKIEIIAAAALIAIFVLLVMRSGGKIGAKRVGVFAKANPHAVGEARSLFPPAQERVKDASQGERVGWGRDPFSLEQVGEKANAVGALNLMGITAIDAQRSKAIINNEIVSVGSKIGIFTVTKIVPNKVVVSDGKAEYALTIQ